MKDIMTIGLTDRQARVWLALRELRGGATAPEIRKRAGLTRSVTTEIHRMLQRQFVEQRYEQYLAITPPHIKVLQEICDEQNLTLTALRAPSKDVRLVRARRMLAKRLRASGYTYRAIGELLNRKLRSIQDYSRKYVHRDRSAYNMQRRMSATLQAAT